MYGVLASLAKSQGKPLVLTLSEEDGSGWLIRGRTAQPGLERFQRWKRVLGFGPYVYRDGLFRFGYAYMNEALGRPLVMTSLGAHASPDGGVVRAVPRAADVEPDRFGWAALWGLQMPNEGTKESTLIAAQSSDALEVVLDIANGEDGADVITFRAHGGNNQKWLFQAEQ